MMKSNGITMQIQPTQKTARLICGDKRTARSARSRLGWVPGNPESITTKDLQQRGLANEMKQVGLCVIRRHTTRPEWIKGIVAESDRICIELDTP
jgi:hypothetical protein